MIVRLILIIFMFFSTSFAEDSAFDIVEDPDANDESVFDSGVATSGSDVKESGYYKFAKIIALNKITANSREIKLKVGEPSYFHNAEINLKKCWQSPDKYMPSNRVLITVNENKVDEDSRNIFHGWLISSQPSLSTLEHPVYEIFAVECLDK